jgi:hypothetical protein
VLNAFWSTVPIFFKPDAISGSETIVSGRAASDFAACLARFIEHRDVLSYNFALDDSAIGAAKAIEHANREITDVSWYNREILEPERCAMNLCKLSRDWVRISELPIPLVFLDAAQALLFDCIARKKITVTEDIYAIYYGNTNHPQIHKKMKPYLIGSEIVVALLCGKQDNSALQMMKTFGRFVMKYSNRPYDYINWIHVANPDDPSFVSSVKLVISPNG